MFQPVRLACRVGAQAPIRGTRRPRGLLQRTGAGLTHGPVLAAGHRLVAFVAVVGLGGLRAVDPQPAVRLGIEMEGVESAGAGFVEYGAAVPRLAAVAREQQKRIARHRAERLPSDPSRLEIEELDEVQACSPDALVGFGPRLAADPGFPAGWKRA